MTQRPLTKAADSFDKGSAAQGRLRLSGSRAPSEHIDGAWWPRSSRLTDELDELVSAVSGRLGPLAVVAYRLDGWVDTPSEAVVGGHTVALVGFASDEPASVVLIGQDGHHVTLHVVSPAADSAEARRVLDGVPQRPPAPKQVPAAMRTLAVIADKLAGHEADKLGIRDSSAIAKRKAQILQWCQEAADQFDDARVQVFVPILVEHIVHNRMYQSPCASPPDAKTGQDAEPAPADT